MEYQIVDLADLAAAFREMAAHERQQWVGTAKFRQREREVRARAYEKCAAMVEQTKLVSARPSGAQHNTGG